MPNKLEIMLRKAGRELADHQVARFFKMPEEMQQTPCDFIGYTASGRAILIEAKMVNAPQLKIGSSPGLSVHQWNELCDAEKAGAIALVCWARGDQCVCLTPENIRVYAGGTKSIRWDDIHRHRSMKGPKAHLTLLAPFLMP